MSDDKKYYLGYILAGLYNFSIIFFNKFFTNDLGKYDNLFNFNGIIMILLWGISYVSIYDKYQNLPFLNFVFFVEKMYFVFKWIIWQKNNFYNLPTIFTEDKFTGIFYAVYGIGDFAFGLFFLTMGLNSLLRGKTIKTS